MEFHQKLQELRKQRNLTQEELAQALFVSRTAVSKWESARGYPNIDSLKAISKFFAVSIDDLLSSEELLTLAVEDQQQKKHQYCDLIYGLLDVSIAMFFFLPLFGETNGSLVNNVSLLSLSHIALYTKALYYGVTISMVVYGIVTLALQHLRQRGKLYISLFLNTFGVLVFILSPQPYAASFLFLFLAVKIILKIR